MLKISSVTKKAYTLVELSIVLVVISIFLSSGLNIFTNNIVQTKTVNTKEKLNIIYKALAEYLMINKRFPCPIKLNIAKDNNSNYGFTNEATTPNNCASPSISITIGALPARNLNLPSEMVEDDFGNKILYVIDNRLIQSSFNTTAFLNNNNNGDGAITIADAIDTKPVLLLLSSGANSCGSYKINGTQNTLCITASDGAEQVDNSDSNNTYSNNTFYANATNPKFDDVILTKTYYDFLQELNLTNNQAQGYFQ